jgi:hypothetical protein
MIEDKRITSEGKVEKAGASLMAKRVMCCTRRQRMPRIRAVEQQRGQHFSPSALPCKGSVLIWEEGDFEVWYGDIKVNALKMLVSSDSLEHSGLQEVPHFSPVKVSTSSFLKIR